MNPALAGFSLQQLIFKHLNKQAKIRSMSININFNKNSWELKTNMLILDIYECFKPLCCAVISIDF